MRQGASSSMTLQLCTRARMRSQVAMAMGLTSHACVRTHAHAQLNCARQFTHTCTHSRVQLNIDGIRMVSTRVCDYCV